MNEIQWECVCVSEGVGGEGERKRVDMGENGR